MVLKSFQQFNKLILLHAPREKTTWTFSVAKFQVEWGQINYDFFFQKFYGATRPAKLASLFYVRNDVLLKFIRIVYIVLYYYNYIVFDSLPLDFRLINEIFS